MLIEHNHCSTTWKWAQIKYPNQVWKIIRNSLVMLMVLMFGFHRLSEKNFLDCTPACDSLLKCNENVPLLKQIVTGSEKWILYSNVELKRPGRQAKWTTSNHTEGRSSPRGGDVVYMVGLGGVCYCELLWENRTVTSNQHCSQTDQPKAALEGKCLEFVNRECVIFSEGDTRPRVSLMTRENCQRGRAVLTHPPCRSDMAPSDFCLFRPFQSSSNGGKLQFPGKL